MFGQRLTQLRERLLDVALAPAATVVQLARDAYVGLGLEFAEREVFQLPLDLPDTQPVGQRRMDVAGQLRKRLSFLDG